MFELKNRPQWYTVSNRSRTYVKNILSKISGEHFKNYKVNMVKCKDTGVDLYYGGENEFFDYDKVIISTHADEALSLIENPTKEDEKIFYQNLVIKKILLIFIQMKQLCQKIREHGVHGTLQLKKMKLKKFNYLLVKFVTKFKVR